MIDKLDKDLCTGCYGCLNVCPQDAISFVANNEGFKYPQIDADKCTKCNLCEKRCPIMNKVKTDNTEKPKIYAAWNINEEVRVTSTSGGIFTALANAVLQKGGYVAGATYTEDFSIQHIVVNDKDGITKLKQSKYAQSDMNNVYRQIKDLLLQDNMVMFCGTPCQAAALRRFLCKNYDNLYVCDFICRGIISQKVYHKFLDDMGKQHKGKLQNVQFKNKDFGWNRFSTKLSYNDGSTYHLDRYTDYYMVGYLKHNLYLRPSCHNCRFKELPRVADISLGDFWGIANFDKALDNNKGTSVVLVNSEKGTEMFQWINKSVVSDERTLEEVTKGNSCLLNVAPTGQYRDYFFKNMDKMDFAELITKIDKKATKVPTKELLKEYATVLKNKIKK